MEIRKADRDKLIFRDIVNFTTKDTSPWLALMCDKFYELSYPQKRGLLTYFIELDIGDKKWEKYFEDESLWIECWGNITYYFTGRKDVRGEPDQEQFLELLKEYFGSELYDKAKTETDDKPVEDFKTLLEDL